MLRSTLCATPRLISYRRVVGDWSMPRPVRRSKSWSTCKVVVGDTCCLLKSGWRSETVLLESCRAGRVRGRKSPRRGFVEAGGERGFLFGSAGSFWCCCSCCCCCCCPRPLATCSDADREGTCTCALKGEALGADTPAAGAAAGLRRSHMAAFPPQELLAAPPPIPLPRHRPETTGCARPGPLS